MSGIFRLAALIEVTALLMLALCGRASGCSSWRCGRSHRGVAAHETKDLGLFAYGAKLPLGGAAISMSAVQGPDGKVFVAGVRNRPHTLPVPLRPFRASQYLQFWSLTESTPYPSLGECSKMATSVLSARSALPTQISGGARRQRGQRRGAAPPSVRAMCSLPPSLSNLRHTRLAPTSSYLRAEAASWLWMDPRPQRRPSGM